MVVIDKGCNFPTSGQLKVNGILKPFVWWVWILINYNGEYFNFNAISI